MTETLCMRGLMLLQCLLLASLAPVVSGAEDAPQRPNIIFIFADDWGWGDLSCHGNEHYLTPNIDRMAEHGTDFHQFTVASPVCSPSRAAIMTGHFPARHSIHRHFASVNHNTKTDMPDWLDPQVVMLPRLLQQAGYRTAHFGKWHLTNRSISDAPTPQAYGYDESQVFNGPGPQIDTQPSATVGQAIEFMRRTQSQPFFINLWLHETHLPHFPQEEFIKRFGHLPEGQREYAAVLADADHWVGRLLDTVDELNLSANTLIVFSSDNGPAGTGDRRLHKPGSDDGGLGNYYSRGETAGLRGQKAWLAEGGVRVPFLVYWPGRVPAKRIDNETVINGVDVLPTFCAVAQVPLPEDYVSDGENMLPAFLGEVQQRTKPLFYEWPPGGKPDKNWMTHAVRDGRWKLLASKDRFELYDIIADRTEATDLAAEHPEEVTRLKGMLEEWRATLPESEPSHCFSSLRKE